MSPPGEIVVVRHGRTAANAGGLLLGHLDVPLDDLGRAQAAALVGALPRPDLVVSSPLRRCRETAEGFGLPVEVDPAWIELDYGEWDGRPMGEIPPTTWAAWREDLDFAPPGGESLRDLTQRVHGALDALLARLEGRRGVVVSHVSPVKAAVSWALGVAPDVAWRTFVAPGSITRIGAGPGGPILSGFNETAHLPTV